ncbi:unnamed protein product, partial [Prorocentrum cordatum]
SATFAALCGASTAPEAERRGRAESCHLREAAPRRAGPPSAPRTATARSAQREPLRRASPSIIEEGEEEEQEEEEDKRTRARRRLKARARARISQESTARWRDIADNCGTRSGKCKCHADLPHYGNAPLGSMPFFSNQPSFPSSFAYLHAMS